MVLHIIRFLHSESTGFWLCSSEAFANLNQIPNMQQGIQNVSFHQKNVPFSPTIETFLHSVTMKLKPALGGTGQLSAYEAFAFNSTQASLEH